MINIDELKKDGYDLLKNHRLDEAKVLFEQACNQSVEDAEAWFLLGMTNKQLGNIDEATHCYQKAAGIQPQQPEIHYNLAKTYELQGNIDAAINSLYVVMRLRPGFAPAYTSLGSLQHAQKKYEDALANHRKAVELDPQRAEAHFELGQVLKDMGRFDDASKSYHTACQLKPDFIAAFYNLGIVSHALGNARKAMEYYKQTILLKPNHLGAFVGLGNALRELGFIDDAIECFQHIIRLKPDLPGAHHNLANLLKSQSKLEMAKSAIEDELKLQPDLEISRILLGDIYADQGNIKKTIRIFQDLIRRDPQNSDVHWKLIMSMHYRDEYSAEDLFEEAVRWGSRHTPQSISISSRTGIPDSQRRIRLGYVSGDFYLHPVGHFIFPIFCNHNKTLFDVYCYYNNSKQDDLTKRLRRSVDNWRDIPDLSDEAVIRQIQQDEIDILIDLSGFTAKNRLTVFAHKPSPIQVTWLGYFDTTGLKTMDYIIADRIVIPGEEQQYYTEKVTRLSKAYLCFSPPDDDIDPGPLPGLKTDRITFGCFNNPAKITEEVMACWSRLLHALPQAQLFLKYPPFGDISVQRRYQTLLAENGIDISRIKFSGLSPRTEFLATYREVDIALDPFPYSGGTTTIEALWMGIPVVSLRGRRFVSRVAETILTNTGLSDCVTDSEEAYIARAVELASDLPRLAELRSGLRNRLLNSPLCDGPGFTRDLEAAYHRMWETWCRTQTNPS